MQTRNPPITHRDLRSPNIFITADNKALIGDFGMAQLANPIVCGILSTWQWLAPECIDTHSDAIIGYDSRSDIYSFGALLFELAAIQIPYFEYKENPLYCLNGAMKLQDIKYDISFRHLRPTIPSSTPGSFSPLPLLSSLYLPLFFFPPFLVFLPSFLPFVLLSLFSFLPSFLLHYYFLIPLLSSSVYASSLSSIFYKYLPSLLLSLYIVELIITNGNVHMCGWAWGVVHK